MRLRRHLALATAGALLATGCAGTATDTGVPAVAATVAGVEIPSDRIERIVDLQAGAIEEGEDQLPEARLDAARQALSAEIQLTAVEEAVEERFGLDIPDEDIDAAFEEQIEAQGGDEAFDELAGEQGLDPADAREFARDNAYVGVLVDYIQEQLSKDGGPDEAELRELYDADVEAFQSADVRHILVDTEPEAQDVLDRLEAGEDFGDLAGELSQDPGSGANGGSLGVAPRGSYVEPFSEAVYSEDTEIGEVVGPVESQFGFHLIIVDERITQSFDEVREQLSAQVELGQFEDFLATVFEEVEVDVDPYYGEWDAARRMVVPVATEDDASTDDSDASETDDSEG